MITLPLNLDLRSASMLYILLDVAANSLAQERATIETLKSNGAKLPSPLEYENLPELLESIDALLDKVKEFKIDTGEIIESLEDTGIPFQPSVKPFNTGPQKSES